MTGYTVTCDQPGRISINMGDIQYDILDLASAGKLNRDLKNAIATAWPGTIVSVDCFDHVERLCRVLSKLGYATPESKEEAAASSDRLVLTLIRAADDLCDRLSKNTEEINIPFDIERAKSGDAVEWLNNDGKWEFVPQNNLVYLHGQDARLRMKYPLKISSTKETEYCTYPECPCPFDAPSNDPDWCAIRLPHKPK